MEIKINIKEEHNKKWNTKENENEIKQIELQNWK